MAKPLKRHPALFPLSRQHHQMLVLAQLMKLNAPPYRNLPTDPEGKRSHALDLYYRFIGDHFQREEEQLLPQLEFRNAEMEALARDMRAEHEALNAQFGGLLLVSDEELLYALDQLGHDLEKHIRKEERQWFTRIQECLTDEEMESLDLNQ